MIFVSDDGYVRLSSEELKSVHLVHHVSGLDEDVPHRPDGAATLSGYTEWVSYPDGTITVGWDWEMEGGSNTVRFHRISEPRTNVMMRDSSGEDAGPAKTLALLAAHVDNTDWQSELGRFLSRRYGGTGP